MTKIDVNTANFEECQAALKNLYDKIIPLAVSERWALESNKTVERRLKELLGEYFTYVTDDMASCTLQFLYDRDFWKDVREFPSQQVSP